MRLPGEEGDGRGRVRLLRVALLALALGANPLVAQSVSTIPDTTVTTEEDSPEKAYLLGVGIGMGGFLAGGLAGLAATSGCTGDDYCGARGFLIGAAVGGTLGMALGVHLGNDRRGSLPLDMLTGAAVWGIGIGGAALSDWDDTVTFIAAIGVPIVQLLTTVAVERATGRSRDAKRNLSVSAGPNLQGGLTLAASLHF